MRKMKLDNKDLDLIGKKLIESGRMPQEEIDSVIAAPYLFERIVANRNSGSGQTVSTSVAAAIKARSNLRNAFVFAGIVVLLVTVIAGLSRLLSDAPKNTALNEIKVPVTLPETARPDLPPQQVGIKLSPGRARISEMQAAPSVAKYETRETRPRLGKRPTAEPSEEFYAVSDAGDLADSAAGGRIIRVDMPRTSLLAMGVNVPLENDADVIRADLLVGADGVTRAIRLIR
jgi:hypothetical protein